MWRFLQKAGWLTGAALMLGLVADVHEPAVWASARGVKEFHHRMWTSDNGIGAVFDIQQAPNGYLWLTTSTGVFRFDGVRFQSVEEVTNGEVQNSEIHSAFVSSSGGVWLKTRAAGLLYWKDERLTVFRDRRCTPASQLEGLAEDRDGSLWVQGSGGFFHLRGSVCEQVGVEQGYPGGFPAAILVDSTGTVWVKTLSGGLLFLPLGQSKFQLLRSDAGTTSPVFVLATPTHKAFLHEAPDGTIWLSDDYGLRRVTNRAGEPVLSSPRDKGHKENTHFGDFTFGKDGSLWVVSDKGIRRFEHADRWQTPQEMEASPSESFTTEQGLSSNAAWKVFIDREGSVWVGTNSGLDLLRRTTLTSLALPPTAEHDFSIVAGDRGSVWTGNKSLPLTRVAADGSITSFPETHGTICLRRDRHGTIWSAGGDPSKLWRSSATGLTPLRYNEERVGPAISLAFDCNDDLWMTTGIGGTYHLSHGEWSRQNEALGKKPGIIGAMSGDESGNVWFGFSNYVVRWDGRNYSKFSFPDGTRGVSKLRCRSGVTMFGLVDRAASNCLPRVIFIFCIGTTRTSRAECQASSKLRRVTFGPTDLRALLGCLLPSWQDGSATQPPQFPASTSMHRTDFLGFQQRGFQSHQLRNQVMAGCGLRRPKESRGWIRRSSKKIATTYRHRS